jgi:hypothetical protein
LSDDKSSTEKENGAVHKDFETLAIAKVQPRNRDVPEKRGHRAAEQHEDADKVFGTGLIPARLIVGWTHRCPPSVK